MNSPFGNTSIDSPLSPSPMPQSPLNGPNLEKMSSPNSPSLTKSISESRKLNKKLCGLCAIEIRLDNWTQHWKRNDHKIWIKNNPQFQPFQLQSGMVPPLAKPDWLLRLSSYNRAIFQYQNLQGIISPRYSPTQSQEQRIHCESQHTGMAKTKIGSQTSLCDAPITQESQDSFKDQTNYQCTRCRSSKLTIGDMADLRQDLKESRLLLLKCLDQNTDLIALLRNSQQQIFSLINQTPLLQKRLSTDDIDLQQDIFKRQKRSLEDHVMVDQQNEVSEQLLSKDTIINEKDRIIEVQKQQIESLKECLKSKQKCQDLGDDTFKFDKQEENKNQVVISQEKDGDLTMSDNSSITTFFGRNLYDQSIATLEGEGLINDEIIDFFLWTFCMFLAPADFRNQIQTINSTVFTLWSRQLSKPHETDVHQNAAKTIQEFGAQSNAQYFLIPIHHCSKNDRYNHWSLGVIILNSKMKNQENTEQVNNEATFIFMDSPGWKISKYKKALIMAVTHYLNQQKPHVHMSFYTLRLPKQDNDRDCGIYVIEYAERFIVFHEQILQAKFLSARDQQEKIFDNDIMKTKREELLKLINDLLPYRKISDEENLLELQAIADIFVRYRNSRGLIVN